MSRTGRVIAWTVGALAALVVLYFLFEWAGTFLDSGGAVGS